MNQRNNINKDIANCGKIPPQATEVEAAVLGALMLERDAFISIASILKAESFYKDEHQKIFKAIQFLVTNGKAVDLLMVTQELRNRKELDEVGGPIYITQLTSRVASAAHIEHHARIIAQKFMARELIRITSKRGEEAFDESGDIDETFSGLQNDLIGLMAIGQNQESCMVDAIREIEEQIEINQNRIGLSGIGTGLQKFDQFTGGLQKTDLIIIAGESSQGKTSLALTMLKNAVMKHQARAAVYSLEMSKKQLVSRIIAQETDVSAKKILSKALTNNEINQVFKVIKILNNLPVYFDESSCSTIDQICNSIRKFKIKHNINLAVVDYLQLVGTDSKNKSEEGQIAEIARRLKNIAKELNITVIALSQLSRDKANPKPTKNRLRGSGQIEEAADLVLLVWRPEEYDINEFSEPHKGIYALGLAECIIAKGRNIGTGSFLLRFNPETTGFCDYVSEYSNSFPDCNQNRNISQADKSDF